MFEEIAGGISPVGNNARKNTAIGKNGNKLNTFDRRLLKTKTKSTNHNVFKNCVSKVKDICHRRSIDVIFLDFSMFSNTDLEKKGITHDITIFDLRHSIFLCNEKCFK